METEKQLSPLWLAQQRSSSRFTSRATAATRSQCQPWRFREQKTGWVTLNFHLGSEWETSETSAGQDREARGDMEASACTPPELPAGETEAARWSPRSAPEPLQHWRRPSGTWVPVQKQSVPNGESEKSEGRTARPYCYEFQTRYFMQSEISVSTLPFPKTQNIHEIWLAFKMQAYLSTNFILSTFILSSKTICNIH